MSLLKEDLTTYDQVIDSPLRDTIQYEIEASEYFKNYVNNYPRPESGLVSIPILPTMGWNAELQEAVPNQGIFHTKYLDGLANKFGTRFNELRILDDTRINHYMISMISSSDQSSIWRRPIPTNYTDVYNIKPYDCEGVPYYSNGRLYFDRNQFNNDEIAITLIGNKATMIISDIAEKNTQEIELSEGGIAFLQNCDKYSWRIKPNNSKSFRALFVFRFGHNDKFIAPTYENTSSS